MTSARNLSERETQRIFNALSSDVRRQILTHLSGSSLTSGEIAARFDMAKPSVSQHLAILEEARLVSRVKRGQFVHYALDGDTLSQALTTFVQDLVPASPPPAPAKKEGRSRAKPAEPKIENAGQMSLLDIDG